MPLLPHTFREASFPDFALLDSGDAWKLERYGALLLARPDPQALWRRRLPAQYWERVDLRFERESDRGGRWVSRAGTGADAAAPAREWTIGYAGARFLLRPTPFKHLGLFPEQAANWEWLRRLHEQDFAGRGERPRLLNLFGYTGAASVLAAKDGWSVTHVDASRTSIAWALENARASGLEEKAVRVLVDDALSFARREVRRGAQYDAILMDPPHHGKGPKGETWQLETGLAPLVEACGKLLAERACLVLSSYAVGYSPLSFANLLGELGAGEVEAGELVLSEEKREGLRQRVLPCGYCARFTRGLELGV